MSLKGLLLGMYMLGKQCQKTPIKVITASVISALIAITFFITSLEVSDAFGLGYVIFELISLILGVAAVVEILRSWKLGKVSAMVELLALLLAGYIVLALTLSYHSNWRLRRTITFDGSLRIRQLGNLVNEYVKKNGRMPDANHWCDSLIGCPLGYGWVVTKNSFAIAHDPSIECNFAFNKNLSNLSIDGLPINVVVLFEADGTLNLSGGTELIDKKRAKDYYFLFKKQRFIYVLYVDGTITKYRLYDGAVSIFDPNSWIPKHYDSNNGVYFVQDPNKKEFSDYFNKGQTSYSPLKWE